MSNHIDIRERPDGLFDIFRVIVEDDAGGAEVVAESLDLLTACRHEARRDQPIIITFQKVRSK